MDVQRVAREVRQAAEHFAYVEAHPTSEGGVCVKAGLQTAAARVYVVTITFQGYPNEMPKVYVTKPALTGSPHRYPDNQICFMHPNVWNPGRHDLKHVLFQVAVWLNKYDVYQQTGNWPGPEIKH